MNRYIPSETKRFVLSAISAVLVVYVLSSLCEAGQAESGKKARETKNLQSNIPTPYNKSSVHLYFMGKNDHFLMSEQRTVIHPGGKVGVARAIVEALIEGPREGLLRTIPSGTRLQAIYVTSDRVCYVDVSEEIRNNHPGGSKTELLTIYSVVNSLILNAPEINSVKILINGNEASTLAGHINLQFPVKANMLLIR